MQAQDHMRYTHSDTLIRSRRGQGRVLSVLGKRAPIENCMESCEVLEFWTIDFKTLPSLWTLLGNGIE